MNMGDHIRRLRLGRSLTQAALAEQLGVSDRAVSRWERNISCPDVSLLPRLALVLGASTDTLLGVDPLMIEADILRATEECARLLREKDVVSAISLMREKNTLYPNQPELMVYLARALLALKTEEAAREALRLCRAADGRKMRLSSTFGCKQVMAHALYRLGKPEQAAQLIEDEMPAIWVSRELLLPRVAPQERADAIRRSNVTLLSGLLCATLDALSTHSGDPDFAQSAGNIRREIEQLSL